MLDRKPWATPVTFRGRDGALVTIDTTADAMAAIILMDDNVVTTGDQQVAR